MLSVNNLSISFGDFVAVKDLSFQLDKGKTLAIVGESGSGKSLTALNMMGLLPNTAAIKGEIIFSKGEETKNLQSFSENDWKAYRGKTLAMVFQEPMSALNPVMKIGKQLSESILAHQQLSKQEAQQKAIEWLRKVQLPEPEKLYHRFPHQLSGGQKQRVMIAMAMCHHPSVLIADEPTTALDVTVQQEVINLMKELQQEFHTSLIFITHDLALASSIADDVLVMYKGEVMEYGPVTQVLQNPQHPYTKALLACRPSLQDKNKRLPVVSDFWQPEGEPAPEKKQTATIEESPIDTTDKLLEVKDVNIWFPTAKDWLGRTTQYFKAVNGVSFDLYKGEILGLVGESGCGKSTLSRSLMGLLPVREGQINYMGKDLAKMDQSEWKEIRRSIQMIFQDPFASLNPRMTIGSILTEPLIVHNIVPRNEVKEEALRLLDLVQLPATAFDRYPHQFSGGQRQRIGIARALALRPQLLICDESVSALDVSVQAQILNLLKDLKASFQFSYLFISHDLTVVHYLCDRIMVMQKGQFVEINTADNIIHNPQDPYTKRLISAMP